MIELVIVITLLALGLVAGGAAERKHLRSLDDRERAHADIFTTDIKTFPHADPHQPGAEMLVAEVVIAADYLKTFLAGLRGLIGGEMRSYQTLLLRGRREAMQRLREQARARGYDALGNVRFETADVGGNASGRRMPMAAILASGTAYHTVRGGRAPQPPAP